MRGKKAHSSGKSCLCTFKKLDAFLGLKIVCIIIEFSEITGPGILMKNYSIFQGHSFDIYLCLDYIYLLTIVARIYTKFYKDTTSQRTLNIITQSVEICIRIMLCILHICIE